MKFILKFISKAWEVVAAFNLFSRKKREENLLFCPSSLKKKKKKAEELIPLFLPVWPGNELLVWKRKYYTFINCLFSPLKVSFFSKAICFAHPWRQLCWQCTSRINFLWLLEVHQSTGEQDLKRLQGINQSTVQPQGSLSRHSHGCLSDLFQKPSKDGDSHFLHLIYQRLYQFYCQKDFSWHPIRNFPLAALASVFLSYLTWAKLFLSPFQRSFYNTRCVMYPLQLLFWQNRCFPSDLFPYDAVSWPLLKPSACL